MNLSKIFLVAIIVFGLLMASCVDNTDPNASYSEESISLPMPKENELWKPNEGVYFTALVGIDQYSLDHFTFSIPVIAKNEITVVDNLCFFEDGKQVSIDSIEELEIIQIVYPECGTNDYRYELSAKLNCKMFVPSTVIDKITVSFDGIEYAFDVDIRFQYIYIQDSLKLWRFKTRGAGTNKWEIIETYSFQAPYDLIGASIREIKGTIIDSGCVSEIFLRDRAADESKQAIGASISVAEFYDLDVTFKGKLHSFSAENLFIVVDYEFGSIEYCSDLNSIQCWALYEYLATPSLVFFE